MVSVRHPKRQRKQSMQREKEQADRIVAEKDRQMREVILGIEFVAGEVCRWVDWSFYRYADKAYAQKKCFWSSLKHIQSDPFTHLQTSIT